MDLVMAHVASIPLLLLALTSGASLLEKPAA